MMRTTLEKAVILFSWGSLTTIFSVLAWVIFYLFARGGATLGPELIFGSVPPVDALLLKRQVFDGLFPAITGTFFLVVLAVLFALPFGVGAGIYMAEFAPKKTKRLFSLIFDILAGLPSIVIGLGGFSITILLHHILPGRLGPCLFLSAAALAFLILPYLIRSTQLALESIPLAIRQTAPALGAGKIQNILRVLLPYRFSDILGGVVLSIGRAAEDTAVIMLTGAVASAGMVRSLFEQFEALPFYIYYISSQYTDVAELQTGFGAAILLLTLCGLLFITTFLIEQFISQRLKR